MAQNLLDSSYNKIYFMKQINIKVALCLQCGGYHSSVPADQSQNKHPQITDHLFYHGEPWFTLDENQFEMAVFSNNSVVKIISLKEHQENDKKYCNCSIKNASEHNQMYKFPVADELLPSKTHFHDNDPYFTELYRLCYIFQ